MGGTGFTILGGVLTILGIISSIYGGFLSGQESAKKIDEIDEKQDLLLDTATNKDPAVDKIVGIRKEMFAEAMKRASDGADSGKEIYENSKQLAKRTDEKENAVAEQIEQERTEYKKKMIPLVLAFADEYLRQVESLPIAELQIETPYIEFDYNYEGLPIRNAIKLIGVSNNKGGIGLYMTPELFYTVGPMRPAKIILRGLNLIEIHQDRIKGTRIESGVIKELELKHDDYDELAIFIKNSVTYSITLNLKSLM